MGTFIDISGKRFGKWTVLHRVGGYKWLCQCDCGVTKECWSQQLREGRSLGCISCHTSQGKRRRHGSTDTTLYNRWCAIKQRCLNPNNHAFRNYGGRGITMFCDWAESFERFASDVGEPPFEGASIDRIDNDGNYEPGNIRWVTAAQQGRNKRNNRRHDFRGKMLTLSELSEISGISRGTLKARIQELGWNIDRAATTPLTNKET